MYRLVLTFGLVLLLMDSPISAKNLNERKVKKLAQKIHTQLNAIHEQNTAYSVLTHNYSQVDVTTSEFEESHWKNIISDISAHISTVTQDKKAKLEEIVGIVNNTINAHNKPDDLNYVEEIVDIGKRNVSIYLQWYYQPFHLIDVFVPVVKINLNETHNDLNWTDAAFQEVEKQNITKDRYFIGTTHGVLRFSPEQTWPRQYDMYDSRLQPWFLEAASSKHDIALMIDRSGSVYGITLKTIMGFARLIIKLIPSNYRFNVFLFNNDFDELKGCFGKGPLEANETVKRAFLAELIDEDAIVAANRSDINDALQHVKDEFFTSTFQTEEEENKKMAILFTDGKMDFEVEDLKARVQNMNLKLLVLDFASPVSPGPNKQLQKMTCEIEGHYVFVKDIGDWFGVVDMLFDTISARSVKSVSAVQNKFRWSQPTVTFYNRAEKRKSIVLSHPVFKENETNNHLLQGVVGIDILLDHFVSKYSLDAGSLAYEIITLPNGKVISHPRLISSEIVPTLAQVELNISESVLYPLRYLTDAPITKIGLIIPYNTTTKQEESGPRDGTIAGVKYQLVIPANDALKVIMDTGNLGATIGDISLVKNNLFIRPFADEDTMNKDAVVKCLEHLSDLDSCAEPLRPLVQDIIITKTAFDKWEGKNELAPLGNFLITSSGVLWSTLDLTDYKRAIAKNIPDYLEFSADPDKFPAETLLVTRPFGKPIHLSKSVNKLLNNEPKQSDVKQLVLSVLGTRINYTDFSANVKEALNDSDLNTDTNWTTYLLDHKGYVLYPETSDSSFFGEVHSAVFEILVDKGYYRNNTFYDSICVEIPEKSAGHKISLFVMDFVTRLLSMAVSVVINSLLFVQRGISFIMPETNIVENCKRQIFAYERDFAVSDVLQDEYTCDSVNKTECRGQYTVLPVQHTNMLLVLVREDNSLCECSQSPYSRIGRVLDDPLSYCDIHESVPSRPLNEDLIYQEEHYEDLMEEVCKDFEEQEEN